jgi:REP-associated tyrosine transposase
VGQAVPPANFAKMFEYRRRLPHYHPHAAFVFVTWRLWGSMPTQTAALSAYPSAGHAFTATDRVLDRNASGPKWLQHAPIANLIAETIEIGERERHFYERGAWAVMPNYVHLLVLPNVPVRVMMRWLKGSTARKANLLLGRTGQRFWQDESYDHWVRNSREFDRIVQYIEENPVTAGLVASAELWRWSSAGWQAKPPAPPS